MKVLLGITVTAIAVYFVTWPIVYVWLVGFDVRYYWNYLYLAWTNPGELPVSLQITSSVVTVAILILIFGVLRYGRMRFS